MTVRPRDLGPTFALMLALAGCDQGAKSDEAPAAKAPKSEGEAKPAQLEESGDLLTLGAAKIMRAGHADRAFVMAADGTVTLAGAPFATISTDGRMLWPSGELMMTVQADGTVFSSEGPTGMALDESGGTLNLPDLKVSVRFGEDGSIVTEASGLHAQLLGPDSPDLEAEHCTGPVAKTCALITLSYLMALGNPDSAQEVEAPAAG